MNAVLTDARRGHAGLFWMAVGCAALAVVIVGLAVLDQRTLLGAPLWFKPLKFALSFTLYCGVLAWMLGQLPKPAMRRSGWVIVVAAVIELAIIIRQAARGVRSHFNDDSLADALLYSAMGATVVVLWLATLAIALRFLREPGRGREGNHPRRPGPAVWVFWRDRAATTAIRLGLAVGLVGLAEGFLMTLDDAHAVGVPDGGPGLLLIGWSTTGGDLRIAHFVGMHALQILPLLAAGLAVFARRLDENSRVRLVRVAGAGYLGLVVLLAWQALRAQPLLSPDALTLAMFALLVLGVAAGAVAAVRTSRRPAAI
jgi:hypothetical protein